MALFDLRDFKKQASFFLRERLNDARLALTDVSRIQLLTEEATNEDSWGPETRTMAMLADAAFELEEYERIVQVIHRRLEPSKRGHWRQLYKTLVVLEYLLTHGPNSLGKEFRGDSTSVEELSQFNFTDQQGIDRGSVIRKKADRVLELINNPDLRKEERTRARKISVGIRGFGSSTNLEPVQNVGEAIEQQSGHGNFENSCVPCNKSSEVIGSAAIETFQNGPKRAPYEKCISITPQPRHDVSSNSLFGENVTAMSKVSEQKGQMKVFKRCSSSPGYFRESMPARLSRQPADDCIDEADEVNTSLLDAVEEREISSCNTLQEGEEHGKLMRWTSGEFTEDGNINSSPHESALSMFGNINTRSLAENCKSSMQKYEGDQQFLNFSNRHNLPYPVHP